MLKLLSAALVLILWLVAARGPAAAGRVAVLLSAKVTEYEEALKGFKETAPPEIVGVYDMDGDLERGRKHLAEIEAKVKPDLIFAVGIWALQVVVSRPSSIPVVYAMVLNPPSVVGAEAKNVTGALEAIQDGIDALWIVPDETTLSQAVVQQMLLFSYRRRLPLLGLSDRHAQMGALFSLSFASGEDIGRQAGELAQAILTGRPVADVPYTSARKLFLTVNLKAAQKLGLAIPPAMLTRATNVIQ